MKRVGWLFGILLLSQIAGCAWLRTLTETPNDQIDSWLRQHEYDKALAFLAESKGSSPAETTDRPSLEEKINAHIAGYERRVIADAEKAVAEDDWGAAFELYRGGLSRLPNSAPLRHGQQRLLQRYAEHRDALELERLIAKGEWTLRELEVSKMANASSPVDWFGQFALRRKIAEANEVAAELRERGMAARERHQPHAADRVFSLAAKLSSAVDKTARSPRLQDTLPDEELRLRKEQPRIAEAPPGVHDLHAGPQRDGLRPASRGQDQQNAKRVMAAFRKACREKHFKEARRLQSQLEEMGVDTEEFQALRRRLATDIAADVKYLIDVGASHYSRQHYAEALKVWSQAQALDPGNEQLSARIKRVTRVLKKLQALREKGAP